MAFEDEVRAALDELPAHIAGALENVAVVIEDVNRGEPDLYGLFSEQPYMPAVVTIYRRPLVEDFGDDLRGLAHNRDFLGTLEQDHELHLPLMPSPAHA